MNNYQDVPTVLSRRKEDGVGCEDSMLFYCINILFDIINIFFDKDYVCTPILL